MLGFQGYHTINHGNWLVTIGRSPLRYMQSPRVAKRHEVRASSIWRILFFLAMDFCMRSSYLCSLLCISIVISYFKLCLRAYDVCFVCYVFCICVMHALLIPFRWIQQIIMRWRRHNTTHDIRHATHGAPLKHTYTQICTTQLSNTLLFTRHGTTRHGTDH